MRKSLLVVLMLVSTRALAQSPPLLSGPIVDALAKELSGDRALETIRGISSNHRVRGSRPYRASAELIAGKARAAGLEDVKIEEFPADGKVVYGTQRSRMPWDAEFAELWEMRREGSEWKPSVLVASWDKQPMSLAEDSESGDVTAELIDVGAGSKESDYAGKSVRGKLILVSLQADAAVLLGVAKYGAAGIVSYAQNQHTAWWGENAELVRWGHLDSFSPNKTFAFMVSPATAKSLRDRLARGESITMHARVRAGQHPGAYSVVTAAIVGADPRLRQEEIVFSCHLDHPSPGANDNASGCATILEVGVALSKLIKDGSVPRPARTIRFVWPPEVEGTMAILNAKPAWAKRIKAVVHMDMVGAGVESKAVFHVSSGPGSLPSFVYDIAQSFGAWVNDQTYKFAATGESKYPLVSPNGGREPLLAGAQQAGYVTTRPTCLPFLESAIQIKLDPSTTAANLEKLDALSLTGSQDFWWLQSNIEIARLFETNGNPGKGLEVIRRWPYHWAAGTIYLSTQLREEGRLAAKAGDKAGAIKAYSHYLRLRDNPDASIVPQADSVRAALRMLGVPTPRR